jgi:hypothetical protein
MEDPESKWRKFLAGFTYILLIAWLIYSHEKSAVHPPQPVAEKTVISSY